MTEEYDEFGYIRPQKHNDKINPSQRLNSYDQHRIHETKDLFDGDCFLCQEAAKKGIKSYWSDED